jgi:predicted MPP superfamily phosphohydrolase
MNIRRPQITRRRFLGTAAFTAATTCWYTWRIEPHWVEIVQRPLPIEQLPAELHGKTLIQLSGLHIGWRVDDDYLIRQFRRVAGMKPDFLAITGDFISYRSAAELDQVKRVLSHLPKGEIATLAILGNHDYGRKWQDEEVAARIETIVRDQGVDLLRNEARMVRGLHIAGLDDLWSPRFAPETALKSLDPKGAGLVLCHNPDAADLPIWGQYRGWILSGHTHGGQCKPPFLPPPMLPVRNRNYTAGEFVLPGGRKLYINRGLGHLTRVRFNVRPEITRFTLEPA